MFWNLTKPVDFVNHAVHMQYVYCKIEISLSLSMFYKNKVSP